MNTFGIIYIALVDLAYLFESDHSRGMKFRILFLWLKINFKFIIVDRFFKKLYTEDIFGFKVRAFNYWSIRFQFHEVFFRNEYLFRTEAPQPIILDCGANIGFATLYFKWLHPESTIYTFEPDPRTFELLKENVESNDLENVHLFNAAVSDHDGTIDFYNDVETPGSLLMSTKQERMPKQKVTVDSKALSALITEENLDHIDMLKIDVEGAEKEVMQDLTKNKQQLDRIDKIVMEYHHNIEGYASNLGEFLQMFEDAGFDYQVNARSVPVNEERKFQDILLFAYRN